MVEITPQQRQALAESGQAPVRLMDPNTQREYIMLPADVYVRLESLLGDDIDPATVYPAIDRAFAEGWNDPKMDDYDRYQVRP
jgi:hypothetical protein